MDTPNATYAGPLAVRRGPTAWAATAGHEDHADRDAVLWLPRSAAPPATPARSGLRGGQLRQITEDHPIGNLVDAGLLAPVLARHLDGRPDRPADTGLRDLRAGGRYLLCSGGLSPAVETDRCGMYSFRGQTGSRLPLPAGDARPQISRDTGYRETPGGTSAPAFLPDAPRRIGVPSP